MDELIEYQLSHPPNQPSHPTTTTDHQPRHVAWRAARGPHPSVGAWHILRGVWSPEAMPVASIPPSLVKHVKHQPSLYIMVGGW